MAKKRINLALQGGGAHGAFTWGVLERLLQEPDLEIAGISGTSAGALNGAALKAGLVRGGPKAALKNLEWLWGRMGAISDARFGAWLGAASPASLSSWLENSLPFAMSEAMRGLFSPYQYGPFYSNPLRPVAERLRYDAICGDEGPQLFIGATNLRSGKIRVFSGPEISADAILASACLPEVFQAVEIDDPETGQREAYWDGGYTGNPALFPLFAPELPDDILVVNINPLYRDEIPRSARAIANRVNEISFNSSLLRELRAISFVERLLEKGHIAPGAMKHAKIHMVGDDDLMRQLSEATKLVPLPQILHQLREAGHAACERFLAEHSDKIGQSSSVDLKAMFG